MRDFFGRPSAAKKSAPGSFLFLGNIADIFLANKHPGPVDGKAHTEAVAIVIADMPPQPLAAFQDYGNLGMRIHKGFQIAGFRSRILRMHKFMEIPFFA
jgi:hypothetical protein